MILERAAQLFEDWKMANVIQAGKRSGVVNNQSGLSIVGV